ncbi:zinc ribbon domain-containing protein [Heyndrickxia sporothermodurans]
MKCFNCQHENNRGRFCENCGTKLISGQEEEIAATFEMDNRTSQTNTYSVTAKKMSKQYFSYFTQVLKQPYARSSTVGSDHFLNGIITIILYSLFIPFMFYFVFKGVLSDVNRFGIDFFGSSVNIKPPFTDLVIKPFFAYLIFIILVITFTFVAIKLGRMNVSYKEVMARFGAFLIPFVSLLAIGLIISMLKIKFFLFFFLLGFVGSIFLIPPLVIASYRKDTKLGLDVIYGSLFIYVLSFISISIMEDILFAALKSAFSGLFGGYIGL